MCTIPACWVLFFHSAGVGRTGTFIAVDAMMQRLKEKDDLDIYNFVTQMRTKRTFMVQNMVCMYIAIDFRNFPIVSEVTDMQTVYMRSTQSLKWGFSGGFHSSVHITCDSIYNVFSLCFFSLWFYNGLQCL